MALPASQIVTLACQIAKCPGYTTQAGQMLNALLQSLARRYDFAIIRKTVSFPFVPGTQNNAYPVPSDYLRAQQIYYSISGQPFKMDQISYEVYNVLYQGPGDTSYPLKFAVDDSNIDNAVPVIYPYPLPQLTIPAFLVYYSLPADIANPQSSSVVPWFPNSVYLYSQLAAELALITDDDRADRLLDRADKMLRGELEMINDDAGYAQVVKLDPNVFRGPGSATATKSLPL